MKKYWAVAKTVWQELVEYRINFFLEIISLTISFTVIIFIWSIIYGQEGNQTLAGFSYSEMITYLVLSGLLQGTLLVASQGDDVNNDIKQGALSSFLLKPLSPFIYWIVRDRFRKIFSLLTTLVAFIPVVFIFRHYLTAPTLPNLLLFILLAILGSLVHFFLFYLISLFAFWWDETWGERFAIRVILYIASGAIIPLSMIPNPWQQIFQWLPFKFIIYFPLEVYLGKADLTAILINSAYLITWLIFLFGATYLTLRRGLKHYSAVGG